MQPWQLPGADLSVGPVKHCRHLSCKPGVLKKLQVEQAPERGPTFFTHAKHLAESLDAKHALQVSLVTPTGHPWAAGLVFEGMRPEIQPWASAEPGDKVKQCLRVRPRLTSL
jgi:hypothetical protein